MGIELPQSGSIFVPEVPKEFQQSNPALFDWMQKTKRELERVVDEAFNNTFIVSTAMNSGTSGTFTLSSGGSIVVTSGIVIEVTS